MGLFSKKDPVAKTEKIIATCDERLARVDGAVQRQLTDINKKLENTPCAEKLRGLNHASLVAKADQEDQDAKVEAELAQLKQEMGLA